MSTQNRKDSVKLMANDSESIHFMSALIQDGITCTAWFLLKENTLKILINRVCWEKPNEYLDEEKYITRLHSILTINNVNKVITKNLNKKKIRFFSILSISCVHSDKNDHKIYIHFSKGMLQISVSNFSITMKDVSTYWLSSKEPEHRVNSKI